MKTEPILTIILLLLLTSVSAIGQVVSGGGNQSVTQPGDDKFNRIPPLSKGKIILTDGTAINFKDLRVQNDTASFYNKESSYLRYGKSDIYKIAKIGNYAATGAISCGLGGLLGGIVGTMRWNEVEELKDKKAGFIIGATVGCAIIGALVGLAFPREKIIYKNTDAFSYGVSLRPLPDNKAALVLSFNIPIN
jgi:hypothetical protein